MAVSKGTSVIDDRLPIPADAKPVVLMLGWLGSQLRYFNKYAEMWRALGAAPIGHRPTILQTAIPSLADQVLLRFMGDVATFYARHCRVHGGMQPLIVHTFSNAGFMALGTMLHLTSLLRALPQGTAGQLHPSFATHWSNENLKERDVSIRASAEGLAGSPWSAASALPHHVSSSRLLRDPTAVSTLQGFRQVLGAASGVVVDSAPSQPLPEIWTRGLLSAALQQPATGIEGAHPWAMLPLQGLTAAYMQSQPVRLRMEQINRGWVEELPPKPQLYLFSEADAIIPPAHIRAFMQRQAQRGVAVSSRCWPDSQHCEHLRAHPQEYARLVRDFMQRCLGARAPTGGAM